MEGFFEPPTLNEREQQGLIKAFEYNFEYTFELACNTLRDLLRSQGNADLLGSRITLRKAFRVNWISDGEAWMLMIQDRNPTSHAYDCSTALDIEAHIRGAYLSCFQALRIRLKRRQVHLTLRHQLRSVVEQGHGTARHCPAPK